MKEILKKLRKYEIRVRKAINSPLQGDFKSIFKGSGLEFDDVRPYQYGDDVRTIDWNVSAKGHGIFVKTFREEKEQTVFFLVDVSASQEIGADGNQKIDITKEIAALLSLSAIKENSQVGLYCFSDRLELFLKPAKGIRHWYLIFNSLFTLKPKSKKTNINDALKYIINYLHRRSVIFIISDFVDTDFLPTLKGMGRKHDLVVIQIADIREKAIPNLGIIPLVENESKKVIWVNPGSEKFKRIFTQSPQEDLHSICKRQDINYIRITTKEDYVSSLLKLFKLRNKSGIRRAS